MTPVQREAIRRKINTVVSLLLVQFPDEEAAIAEALEGQRVRLMELERKRTHPTRGVK